MIDNPKHNRRIKKYLRAINKKRAEIAKEIGADAMQNFYIETKGISLERLLHIARRFNLDVDDLLPSDSDGEKSHF